MRRAALATLARFASPKSSKTMFEAAERAGFGYDPSNATAALLDYARNLAARGDVAAADKLCRQIMKKTDAPGRLATRAAALAILAEARGSDALPDLVAAVDHADRAYRQSALRAAEPIGGLAAIQRWTAKARTVDAGRRAEIVAMLGRQGDPRALPFIRASLAAREPEVMLAAAAALARMEGADGDAGPHRRAEGRAARGHRQAGRHPRSASWTSPIWIRSSRCSTRCRRPRRPPRSA